MPPTLTEPADSELLERFVRQRDERAFQSLVGRHQAMVTGAALRRTGNLELAPAEQLANTKPRAAYVAIAPEEDASLVAHRGEVAGARSRLCQVEAARAAENKRRAELETALGRV